MTIYVVVITDLCGAILDIRSDRRLILFRNLSNGDPIYLFRKIAKTIEIITHDNDITNLLVYP